MILFTSDVHCGIDQGFGYAGLQQVRDSLLARGDDVILVDDGDNIQGEPIGTMTKGEALVDLMNAMGYSVAITENLGGVIGEEYVDLTGQGRIVIVEEAP